MKLFDFEVPEQIVQEAVNCVKRIDNKTILENITKYNCSKGLGGIRPIPTNLPLIRKKLEELVKSDNAARLVWIQDGALYGKFTVVLSEKALIDGFESLENTFGTAPILLAMLLDEREPIREFAQKKCEQIPVWKIAPQSQEEAQAAFKETFAPFIGEMSHLLNLPEIKEVVREVKSELPPQEKAELINLRNQIKQLNKDVSRLSQVENELSQQKEKTIKLEEQKLSLLENEKQLRSKINAQVTEIDRLRNENKSLDKNIDSLELKIEELTKSKQKQKENFAEQLKNERKNIFHEVTFNEIKQEKQNINPALEFFAQYNKTFTSYTKAKLIIDGHNVLNCPLNTHYASLDLEHKKKMTLLKHDAGKLLDYLPNLIINLHYDSPFENSENYKSEKFKVQYSGGGFGEHRADDHIKKDYGHSILDKIPLTFLVTNDQDIQNYCKEAFVISSESLISLITKLP